MAKKNKGVKKANLPNGEKMQYKRLKDGTYILADDNQNIHTNHLHVGFNNDGSHTILSHKINNQHEYKYGGKGSARNSLSELNEEITGESNKFNSRWQPRNQLTNTQGNTMSKPRNYDAVLAGLQTAKGNIQRNIQQLTDELNHYSRQIEAMKQVGFMEDYADKLQAYNGLKARIDKLEEILHQFIQKITEIEGYVHQLKIDSNRND